VPSALLIYIAGVLSIPGDVYEAASLDGASSWGQLRSITLPLVAGYVLINLVIGFKNFLNAYDIIVGLTDGGPGTSTRSVAMTIFSGFTSGDYAYQMANATIFFLIALVIALVQLRVSRGKAAF
jgi:raffinose/stachyose/melibiose transport system permease protein